MSTLSRYVVRALFGPFVFAGVAITGLLFLTAIAQRFQELAGKGVGVGVILELMVLSLPHVVTLSIPMALFAATLYVFADLEQNREVMAVAMAGVHPWRLVAPVAVVGIALSLLMLRFNDAILAGANARFQDRLVAVARVRPTVQLRAGDVNTLRPADGSARYLWVDSIDRARSELRGVTVVDMSTPNRPVYVTAEHGTVSMRPNGRDLLVELADGQLTLTRPDRPENFHTIAFEHHVSSLRDLVAGFSENAAGVVRAERELSIATLRQRLREASPESVLDVARYRGELHRRYATACACLVFVLLAAPLGRRVAAGGIGAVINLSIAVIFFFRVGIIVGDRLVDAGRVHPILGSWGTVGVLLLVALPLLLHSVLATSSRTDLRGGS